ncbi:MAG: hypothetical protein WED04_06895 [Promethearchaeati archaeon SRVP18_Atabeyarchaeia-1]
MSQTLLLARHELKLMWSEFRFSLRRSLTTILIIQVAAMVTVMHIAFALILFLMFDASPEVGAGLTKYLVSVGFTPARMSEIIYYVMLLFLASSFVRGLLSSSFGWLFTRVDESVIVSSPASPRALYVAKRFRRFLVHCMMAALVIAGAYPVFSRIGFQGFQLVPLYVAILAFIEIYGLVENLSYCLSRGLVMRRSTVQKAILGVAFGAFTFFIIGTPFLIIAGGTPLQFVSSFYPPYLFGSMLTSSLWMGSTVGASLLGIEAILFLIFASLTARFGLKRWAASPRLVQTRGSFIRLRKNTLFREHKEVSSLRLVFMKDFWTTVRVPGKFLVPMFVTLILLAFTIQLQVIFPLSLPGPEVSQFTDPVFLLSTYFVSVFILPPAWDSFASERRTIFLLKTLPIGASSIIRGKYLFALFKSALYITPIIATVSVILPHTSAIPLVALQVTLVLLVSNAVGVLASVSYPPTYRGVGPPPFLVLLGLPLLSLVLTVIIPIMLVLSYGNWALFAFLLVNVVVYVGLVLRFCLRRAEASFVNLQEF